MRSFRFSETRKRLHDTSITPGSSQPIRHHLHFSFSFSTPVLQRVMQLAMIKNFFSSFFFQIFLVFKMMHILFNCVSCIATGLQRGKHKLVLCKQWFNKRATIPRSKLLSWNIVEPYFNLIALLNGTWILMKRFITIRAVNSPNERSKDEPLLPH